MNLYLFEDLPLRTTRVLGDFAADTPLGHAFGDLRDRPFEAVRLSDTQFFAADHYFEVTSVYVDREKTLTFEASNPSDGKGNTWTVVSLGAPVPKESVVWIAGRGKLHPRTGALIENPGDVLENVTNAIAGRADNWQQLRDEASALGLTVAGRVAAVKSIRSVIDEICQSVGAIWCSGMARVYPADSVTGYVAQLGKELLSLGRPQATPEDTADVLRLGYGYAEGPGKAQRFIELSANPQQFGGLVQEVTYLWLNTPANAEAVGRRVLGRMAGERYSVPLTTTARVRPGTWLHIDTPEWPFPDGTPDVMAIAVSNDEQTGIASVDGETIVSTPAIKVTAHSVSLSDTSDAALEISTRDGITTITVSTRDNKPLAGARVSLDGGQTKTTNAQGQVFFTVPAGVHKCLIEAAGMDPIDLDVITG